MDSALISVSRIRRQRFQLGWLALWLANGACLLADPKPAEDSPEAEWRRGAELARVYCAACHLFPEPELLDKRTWIQGTQRKIAPFLGVAQLRLEGRPEGRRLAESHLFPSSPLISQADWKAIWSYYLHEAPEVALEPTTRPPVDLGLSLFEPIRLGGHTKSALSTLVQVDGARHEILIADAGQDGLFAYNARGARIASVPLGGAAVHLTTDGPRRLATLIGDVFPSDVPAGKVVVLPEGNAAGAPESLLTELQRPTGCVVADLNGDGRRDLLVSSFGNYLGRLSWFEQLSDGRYEEHVLLDRPGAIRTELCDANHDGRPDFIVLMAQGNEGLFLFLNLGHGDFTLRPLKWFQPAFGSTGFELKDLNGDGFPDILLTNGDNGEYASPFKRYHGLRILLNDGNYQFNEAWFYPLNGAFKALARDFDGDGDLDIAAVAFFPDYERETETGFVYLRCDGPLKFQAATLPEARVGRWLTMDAGDVDGDGAIDLVLGSFTQGPPAIAIPHELQAAWRTNGVSALLLKNRGVKSAPRP